MVRLHVGAADFAQERRVRDRAFLLVIAGIIVIKLAYVRLLSVGAEASLFLPMVAAFLGLGVATLGFLRFVGYERRTRFSRPSAAVDGWRTNHTPPE